MVIHGNLDGAMAGTNSPVAQTNSSPTTNSAATDTNLPPGKLDLLHHN